jgi:hypothetical protein
MGLEAFLAFVHNAWAFGPKGGGSSAPWPHPPASRPEDGGAAADPLAFLLGPFQSSRASAASEVPWGGAAAAGFLGQVGWIAMMSGFRYWRRLASLWGEYLELLAPLGAGGQGGTAEAEQLLLTEGLRRLARELGETASQEARLFQAELDHLAFGLATPAEEPPGQAPRRYARVKP